jgi:hypothetical protein
MSNVYCKPSTVLHMREPSTGIEHDLIALELTSATNGRGQALYVCVTLEDLPSMLIALGSTRRFGKATLEQLSHRSPSAAALKWCEFKGIKADFVYFTGGYVEGDRPIPEILTKGESRSWVPQWEERLTNLREELTEQGLMCASEARRACTAEQRNEELVKILYGMPLGLHTDMPGGADCRCSQCDFVRSVRAALKVYQ